MGHFVDDVQVVADPAHQMPRLDPVEVAERKLLDVGEKIPPHVRLDPHPQDVTPLDPDVSQQGLGQVNAEHQEQGGKDGARIPRGKVGIQESPSQEGKENRQGRGGDGTEHVQKEEPPVGKVVPDKTPDHVRQDTGGGRFVPEEGL